MSTPSEGHRPGRGGRRKQYQWGNRWAAKSLKWVAIPVLAIVILGLVGFFTARPIYRAFRLQRAERLAKEAADLFGDGQVDVSSIEKALKDIGTALLIAPQSFPVNLTAARIYSKVPGGQSMAINHWQLVLNDARANRTDHLAYIDNAIQVGRYDLVRKELSDRNVLNPLDDEMLWRKLKILVIAGQMDEAVELARVAYASKPEDPERELVLGETLLRSTVADWQQEGRRILFGISLADTPAQAAAARVLRLSVMLAPFEAEQIARALERKLHPELRDLLEGARLRLNARPEQKDQVVESLLAEARPREFRDRLTLSEWLIESEAPGHTLELISKEEALTNSLAMTFRVEALASRSNWSAIDEILTNANKSSLHVTLFDIAAATKDAALGNSEAALGRFRLALEHLQKSHDQRQLPAILARSAERSGFPQIAEEAYQKMMDFPDLFLVSVRQILRLQQGSTTLRRSYPVITRLHDYAPGDAGVAFEFSYLTTLLGGDMAAARTALDGIPKEHPNRAFLAAFVQSRGEDPQASLQAFESASPGWEGLPPRWKAVYVDLLGKAQQREAARSNARQVDLAQLSEEEREMIQEWRQN